MFQCTFCEYSSTDLRLFAKHLRSRHEADPYFMVKCPHCVKTYCSSRDFTRHVKIHLDREVDAAHRLSLRNQPPRLHDGSPSSSGTSGICDTLPRVFAAANSRVPEKHPDCSPEEHETSTADFIIGLRAQGGNRIALLVDIVALLCDSTRLNLTALKFDCHPKIAHESALFSNSRDKSKYLA